ncbi:ABC transporter ATP-binding protein [Candidatus Gottesmanbacteria bacterium]|nr:ABC transporter ATP-binding protein [Candidatus Gottesmanbacteria bacterium]
MNDIIVQLKDVVKEFGQTIAVNHVSIDIYSGEFFSILGPSGCGKTTLLRTIAGFEFPDSGSIYLRNRLINTVPPYHRDVNMVFQNYALFPHMNVYENVAFGLKMKKLEKKEIDQRVPKALSLVGLSEMGNRKATQLSGGQQQRIALARALVNEPSVLLLDEPLGALDLKLRKQMQIELKSLQKQLGITFIYVTHDQEEALTMSDRIGVMSSGKVEQIGTPSQIYEEPNSEFVANFIGTSNLFSGKLQNYDDSIILLKTPDGIDLKAPINGNISSGSAIVMVRPEKIKITNNKPGDDTNFLPGKISNIVYLGTVIQFIVNCKDRNLIVLEKNYDKNLDFELNQDVFISWNISSTVILHES